MKKMQTNNYNVFAEMARPMLMKYIDKNGLTPNEKKFLGLLETWNLKGDPQEKGATVFRCIWDSLEAAVWGDEMAGSKLSLPIPDSYTLLERMLRGTADFMADDITTKGKTETIQDDVMTAYRRACKALELIEQNGKLEWAKNKDTYVRHLLRIPALSRLH